MPSVYEPFGIGYAEAGDRDVPSIETTVGGGADAIGPGGILVAPGNDEGLRRRAPSSLPVGSRQ